MGIIVPLKIGKYGLGLEITQELIDGDVKYVNDLHRYLIGQWARTLEAKGETMPSYLHSQSEFDQMIGELDHCLSAMILHAKDKGLSEVNRHTLKHHAEDMNGAAAKILTELAKRESTSYFTPDMVPNRMDDTTTHVPMAEDREKAGDDGE